MAVPSQATPAYQPRMALSRLWDDAVASHSNLRKAGVLVLGGLAAATVVPLALDWATTRLAAYRGRPLVESGPGQSIFARSVRVVPGTGDRLARRHAATLRDGGWSALAPSLPRERGGADGKRQGQVVPRSSDRPGLPEVTVFPRWLQVRAAVPDTTLGVRVDLARALAEAVRGEGLRTPAWLAHARGDVEALAEAAAGAFLALSPELAGGQGTPRYFRNLELPACDLTAQGKADCLAHLVKSLVAVGVDPVQALDLAMGLAFPPVDGGSSKAFNLNSRVGAVEDMTRLFAGLHQAVGGASASPAALERLLRMQGVTVVEKAAIERAMGQRPLSLDMQREVQATLPGVRIVSHEEAGARDVAAGRVAGARRAAFFSGLVARAGRVPAADLPTWLGPVLLALTREPDASDPAAANLTRAAWRTLALKDLDDLSAAVGGATIADLPKDREQALMTLIREARTSIEPGGRVPGPHLPSHH